MGTDECKFKTHDIILFVVFSILLVFGVLSFFVTPKDSDDATLVIKTAAEAVGLILAFKFGIHQAQAQPGTNTLTQTVVPPLQAPPPPPPPPPPAPLAPQVPPVEVDARTVSQG